METRTKIGIAIKLLSGMLLSTALAIPLVVEAGRGHHHHRHHQDHYHHHHDHRHHHHNHYNTRNIYYNQSYYPPAYYSPVYDGNYGVAPRNFFFGINTGNARFMLGY
ncbi:hypothetical protein [Nitrosomonas communis]|uniref:Uncharacterized protein n=1 Tax=Nitrosomonas communis TaxID=44574 RepID=A0A1H2UQP1_9PROT|nr:hypothetical protein [Nitrosomonas communis]SDW58402.1 hypothetical protein SAMN05421882_101737 [Nitrosomonas communis]